MSRFHRSLRRAGALLGVICTSVALKAEAQNTTLYQGEFRPYVGALIPTGDLGDQLKAAVLVGGQVGWHFHPNVALTGTFGWAPSSDKTTANRASTLYTGREENVDVFQYDLAVEGRMNAMTSGSWTTTPYVSIGGGGRTYSYRDVDAVDSQTNFLGLGALGVDFAPMSSQWGIRLEARDNLSAFKGLRGELSSSEARNDVQITAGLTIRF
jgi:hypothetical protein